MFPKSWSFSLDRAGRWTLLESQTPGDHELRFAPLMFEGALRDLKLTRHLASLDRGFQGSKTNQSAVSQTSPAIARRVCASARRPRSLEGNLPNRWYDRGREFSGGQRQYGYRLGASYSDRRNCVSLSSLSIPPLPGHCTLRTACETVAVKPPHREPRARSCRRSCRAQPIDAPCTCARTTPPPLPTSMRESAHPRCDRTTAANYPA